MKLSIIIIVSIVVGTLVGLVHGMLHFGKFTDSNHSQFTEIKDSDIKVTPWYPPVDGPFPQAVVENDTYDFGAMEVLQEKSHTFKVTNRGAGILRIRKRK